ncbi:MAG: UbiH/UbiF/VisC/COQ6 family ubiquinone biosynthesis hydroxylase [Alphaproteobacteria bacterium]
MKKNAAFSDVLIAGGGIAGLTLGVLLSSAGLDVHLIDMSPPSPNDMPSGRTVALMESSINVLRASGIWDQISPHATPLKTMRIVDESGTEAEFNALEIGMEQYGYNIPNSLLRRTLYNAAKKSKTLTLHVPNALKNYEIEENGALCVLENGTNLHTRIIIGADGRNSAVRRISGIQCTDHDYNQSAITCLIAHSHSHNNTATEFHRPGGPIALVPMPGNMSSVVWIEPTTRADEYMRLKKNEFTQALQEKTQDILGGITLESPPECWPLKTLKAKKLTAARVAIMAEAAHVMSPVTAQGLNLSLRDVAALAETIIDAARAGLDIGSELPLSRYEKRRRLDIHTRVFGVDGMNKIVSTEAGFLKGLRRAGLRIVDSALPLKKTAMRIGLAPAIDAGRLVRGETL